MPKAIVILLLFVSLFSGGLYGKDPVTVCGSVRDSGGSPLPYATIAVKGKTIGSVADRNGNFSVTLPDESAYTIAASHAGYATREREVSGAVCENIDFILPEDLLNIGQVVVTGTRTPKLLKDVPVLTRVITAEDILRSGASDIADLLESELPAVEFSYKMDQQVSLNMQGFGGMSLLFLVDGEPVSGETLDNVDYSRLVVDNLERVEIVKGAASALYGSNAVGGVVNIITKGAARPWSVGVNSRYGSHNSWQNGASLGFSKGRINSVTNFQHTDRDNYSLGQDGAYKTMYGGRTYSLKERLGLRVSDRMELVAKGSYFFRERDYSQAWKNRYRGFQGGVRMNHCIDADRYLEASYNFDQYDKSNYYPSNGKDIRKYSNIRNTLRALYNHILGGGHTLSIGGDAMTDYLMSYQFGSDTDYRQYSADLFAQFDWQVGRQVDLVGGARLDYFSEGNRLKLTPRLAFMYRPGDFTLRASYAGGFRAPTLKELHMIFDMGNIFTIYGNENLRSETSHNLILSGEYTRKHWSASASGYYNSVNDRISTIWSDLLYGMQYVNTRRADIVGAEVNFDMRLTCGLGARASYAYTRELRKGGEINTSDARPHTGLLRLEYGRKWTDYGFNISLSGRFMSPLDTHIIPETSYTGYAPAHFPGYAIWKVTLSQNICKALRVTATVDNVLGYKPDFFYYNSPTTYGREFSVGVTVSIEELFNR